MFTALSLSARQTHGGGGSSGRPQSITNACTGRGSRQRRPLPHNVYALVSRSQDLLRQLTTLARRDNTITQRRTTRLSDKKKRHASKHGVSTRVSTPAEVRSRPRAVQVERKRRELDNSCPPSGPAAIDGNAPGTSTAWFAPLEGRKPGFPARPLERTRRRWLPCPQRIRRRRRAGPAS